MKLIVVTPTETVLEEDVSRIVAEATDGSFGVLERHIDYVAELRPGILVFETASGREGFLGLNWSTFVKRGDEVRISSHGAIAGDDLEDLKARIEAEFLDMDEDERRARLALARLEAGMIRRFIELGNPEGDHGL